MAKKKVAVSLRKPPSPKGLEELDAFVGGRGVEGEASAPRRTSIHEVRPSAMPKTSAPKARRTRPLDVELESALMEELSLHCLSTHRDADDVVADAIRAYLRRDAEPTPPPLPRPSQSRDGETWKAFGFVD